MHNKIDPGKIRALALDLDGTTLLPDTTLGERTAQCLRKLISGGMQILFVTGRSIEGTERYFNAVGASGPMVFFNGAEVADIPSGKILSANLLDLEMAEYGVDLARSMGIHFQLYVSSDTAADYKMPGKNKWEILFIEKERPESEMYSRHTGITPVVRDLKAVIATPGLKGCIKGLFVIEPSLHDEVRRKMYDRFGSRVNVVRSFSTFVEVVSAGVSKGRGLETAMQYMGLSAEEVVAFGDEESDLPMSGVAGFFAAPANARDKVREIADVIYGPVAQEGLAAFLEENFL